MRSGISLPVIVLLIAVALASTLGLTSCSALSGRSDHEWKSADELATSSQSDVVPSFVAADGEHIRLSTAEVGTGPTVLSWQSKSGITREDCKAGSIEGAPSASVPKWWPQDVPGEGWSCGWWRVFKQADGYYSWRQQDAQH